MPQLVASPAFARQVRSRALAAPLVRVIVDELTGLAVLGGHAALPVAHRLVDERPDHLRVAVVATLAQIDVAAVELERRVRLHRGDARHVVSDQERRDDLERRGHEHRRDGEHREQRRHALPAAVKVLRDHDPALEGGRALRLVPRRANHRGHLDVGLRVPRRAPPPGAEQVVGAEADAGDVQRTAERAHPVHRREANHGLEEVGILEPTGAVERPPHEALRDARRPHRDDVKHDADGRDPEVRRGELLRVQRCLVQARDEPVHHPENHESDPAERAAVHVRDVPVGVVRQRVDALDGEHRPLERGHSIERDRDDEELQDWILGDLAPRAAQGEQAVDHPAPRRHPEHDAEHHAQRRRPLRQRRVVEVVGARPDVDEDERPEVQDRQPVAEDGPLRCLGQEVVHEAEERRGEDEGDGVVAVPPLHERVLDARVDRVALEQPRRNHEVVEDVEDRDRDDRGDVEPQRDVEVLLAAVAHHREEAHGEGHPHDGDREIDRPLELRVLLALRVAEGERDRGRDDDRLPPPEVDRGEGAQRARLEQPLRRVVDRREHAVAGEREDDRVRVQRSQPAKGEVRADVQPRCGELQGAPQPDQHADRTPHDRGRDELPDDRIVVAQGLS